MSAVDTGARRRNSDPVEQREIAQALEQHARHRAEDARWASHNESHEAHDARHELEHEHDREITRNEDKRLDAALVAHRAAHDAEALALTTALANVDRLASVHAEAHRREHQAHDQRHIDEGAAVGKAEGAVDKRLEQMDSAFAQMREERSHYASADRLTALSVANDQRWTAHTDTMDRRFADVAKHTDERYEENRRRIESLEKGDIKVEGRGMGQAATWAVIVGAVGFAATLLGLLIVVANVLGA